MLATRSRPEIQHHGVHEPSGEVAFDELLDAVEARLETVRDHDRRTAAIAIVEEVTRFVLDWQEGTGPTISRVPRQSMLLGGS